METTEAALGGMEAVINAAELGAAAITLSLAADHASLDEKEDPNAALLLGSKRSDLEGHDREEEARPHRSGYRGGFRCPELGSGGGTPRAGSKFPLHGPRALATGGVWRVDS